MKYTKDSASQLYCSSQHTVSNQMQPENRNTNEVFKRLCNSITLLFTA